MPAPAHSSVPRDTGAARRTWSRLITSIRTARGDRRPWTTSRYGARPTMPSPPGRTTAPRASPAPSSGADRRPGSESLPGSWREQGGEQPGAVRVGTATDDDLVPGTQDAVQLTQ